MATVKSKESAEAEVAPPVKKVSPRGGLPFVRGMFVMLVLLIALAAAAPTIVLRTPLGEKLLAMATAEVHGSVKIDQIDFGWLAPLEIANLQVLDSAGKPVLTVAHLKSDVTLLGMLKSRGSFGAVRIEEPVAIVELENGQTNFQEVFGAYFQHHAAGPIELPTFELEFVEGSVIVVDRRTSAEWRFDPISAKVGLAANRLAFEQFAVQSDNFAAEGAGTIDDLGGTRMLKAQCKTTYDLDRLEGLVQSLLGDRIRVSGRQTGMISITGALAAFDDATTADADVHSRALEQFAAQADMGWEGLAAYGYSFGPGRLQGELKNGIARIAPLDLPFEGGRLRAAPIVQLAPGPATIQLAPGTVLDQIAVTPEMCSRGLAYIAPLLAGAVQVEGRVSMDVSACNVPINDTGAADITGQLKVHSIDLVPGPVLAQIAMLLDRPGTISLQRESTVDFRMVERRIYHQGLELAFPGATVRTQGSVGLDQSLALLVEMPLPAKLLGNIPLAGSLASQTISVPIGGTLSNPVIDQNELNRLLAQFVQGTVENAAVNAVQQGLQEGMNRGIDQLLGPLK
ncbi:MAG TPA: hypothetical protein VG713_18190 [Pirellulales bacterium]|nr:hypothetical protein [Pirellulales bacterium]